LLLVSHFHIKTPFGYRPVSEFSYGGESRPLYDENASEQEEIDRLWLRRNACGVQRERWFHTYGTRRWYTIVRDTRTNVVLAQPGEEYTGEGGEVTT
jgi:heterotetrameric sarcosine oxidase delta subunit